MMLHSKDYAAEGVWSRGCDLTVVASHGRRELERLLLGSQMARFVTNTWHPCSSANKRGRCAS